jgi:pilus assembly protein CpaE
MAEKVTAEQFSRLLQFLKRMYAYVVVDTASYLTESVQVALENSDLIVLITTQDIPAIKNANAFLMLADASGIRRDRIMFVMNRYDKRISITPERIGDSLRQPITITMPLDERLVASSIVRGIPFVQDNKTQVLSKTIFTMAEQIKEKLAKQESDVEVAGKK